MEQALNSPFAVIAVLALFAVTIRETFFFARSLRKNGHGKSEERIIASLESINTNLVLLNDRLARHLDFDERLHENVAEIKAIVDGFGRAWR